MWQWLLGLSPWWRVQHGLAPFILPFAPSPNDLREWNVELDPIGTVLSTPLPANNRLSVSLHRILIEAGIALTLATSAWDPRSWFALYRYGGDFAGTTPRLRFYSGVQDKDPRLTAVASEEVATGITCYLLREHFNLLHIADVYACIQRGELQYVDPDLRTRPDYFCEDNAGETLLAESKGSVGTRSSITPRIDPDGWRQVQNVTPVNLPLRNNCSRVVIGTHLCVDGTHGRSETTTIIKDPQGVASDENDPGSDQVIRIAYAKALRFMGHDVPADFLLSRLALEQLHPLLGDLQLPKVGRLEFLPMGLTPFGDVIGFYGPVGRALLTAGASSVRPAITDALGEVPDPLLDILPASYGYMLPNGVMIVHNPEDIQ